MQRNDRKDAQQAAGHGYLGVVGLEVFFLPVFQFSILRLDYTFKIIYFLIQKQT